MRHFIWVYTVETKSVFREKHTVLFRNYDMGSLEIYKHTMDHLNFILSNQTEELN